MYDKIHYKLKKKNNGYFDIYQPVNWHFILRWENKVIYLLHEETADVGEKLIFIKLRYFS